MKKVFCILSILTIAMPAFAVGEEPAAPSPVPVAGTPTSYSVQPTGDAKAAVLAGAPLYQLANSNVSTDGNAASAGYVKGAYNAAIKAVNKVADTKQDIISVSDSSSGAVVTGVSLGVDGKTVTVAKTNEVTVPVNASNSSTRANIWIE